MRVVHAGYSDLSGGASKAALRIHQSLGTRGVDSHMIVSKKMGNSTNVHGPTTSSQRIWNELTPYLDLIPFKLFNIKTDGYESLSFVGTNPVPKILSMEPDLVHLHWICAGFMKIGDIKKIKKPIVWRLADMWAFCGSEHYAGSSFRYIDGYFQKQSRIDLSRWTWLRKKRAYEKVENLTVVTPSRWMADCAKNSYLFKDRRVEVIPTGQDVNIYRPLPKHICKEILGLNPDKKTILSGALGFSNDPRKGSDLLLEAINKLRNRKEIELALFGSEGPSRSENLGIDCKHLGRFNDPLSLSIVYSAADIFVAPSREDNLPNTVIEAMACGTPCVAFRIGGMPDIIYPNNGMLSPPYDTDHLASSIEELLFSSQVEYANYCKNARAMVVENFSLESQVSKYISLYEEILKNEI